MQRRRISLRMQFSLGTLVAMEKFQDAVAWGLYLQNTLKVKKKYKIVGHHRIYAKNISCYKEVFYNLGREKHYRKISVDDFSFVKTFHTCSFSTKACFKC